MATSSRSLTSRPSLPRPACTRAGRRGGHTARAGSGGREVTTPAWPRSPSWSTTRPRSSPCQPRLTRVSHYPQFAAVTADIGGYVDQVLAETNLGYINSGVALRVQRFCLELATINDTQLSLSFLNKFQAMKVGPVLAPRVTCPRARAPWSRCATLPTPRICSPTSSRRAAWRTSTASAPSSPSPSAGRAARWVGHCSAHAR